MYLWFLYFAILIDMSLCRRWLMFDIRLFYMSTIILVLYGILDNCILGVYRVV